MGHNNKESELISASIKQDSESETPIPNDKYLLDLSFPPKLINAPDPVRIISELNKNFTVASQAILQYLNDT